ncbi:MAG TPA: PaREP1 family protein, partial [Candidatus Brocadiaceae bacterium]|nr:PaREP1 family protein [Candidatus Brocadiaceae bacterium]
MEKEKTRKYAGLSAKYLHDAKMLLSNGDISKASEKLWGATVTIVKAVAFFPPPQFSLNTAAAISPPHIFALLCKR